MGSFGVIEPHHLTSDFAEMAPKDLTYSLSYPAMSLINPLTPSVLRICRPHLGRVGVAIGALVLVDIVDIALPLVMKGAFDAIGDRDTFIWFALGYSSLLIVQAVLRLLYRTLFPLAQCGFAHSLRTALARAVIERKVGNRQAVTAGDAVPLMTSDAEQTACVLNDGMVIGLDAVLYLLFVPPLMIWVSPWAAIPALLPLIAVPIIARRGERAITDATGQVQEALTALSTFIDEKLRNHETVTLFSLRRRLSTLLEPLSKNQRQRVIEATYADANLSGSIQLCGALAMAILVVGGGIFIHSGALSIGGFVALYQYLTMLFWPLIALGLYLSITQKARVASGRIELMLSGEADTQLPVPNNHPSATPSIIMDNVSVTAPGRAEPILRNISLTIRPGERVAIVGPTGSGKTTLLETLASFHSPEGSISFSIGTSRIDPLDAVALCPQVPRLFSDTIERNLLFWNRSSPDRTAMNTLLEQLFSEEERQPGGDTDFDNRLVDARSGLSGGQRQRITLARTLLSEPAVMLLDNPFSALDPIRESQTIALVERSITDKTLIIVTNHLAPLSLVDRIIVLKDGRIEQDGTLPELRADEAGWFAAHFERQLPKTEPHGGKDR